MRGWGEGGEGEREECVCVRERERDRWIESGNIGPIVDSKQRDEGSEGGRGSLLPYFSFLSMMRVSARLQPCRRLCK